MFQLPIDGRFAQDDAETELRSGFNALSAALGNADDGTATELLWSALHGMTCWNAPTGCAKNTGPTV